MPARFRNFLVEKGADFYRRLAVVDAELRVGQVQERDGAAAGRAGHPRDHALADAGSVARPAFGRGAAHRWVVAGGRTSRARGAVVAAAARSQAVESSTTIEMHDSVPMLGIVVREHRQLGARVDRAGGVRSHRRIW